MTARSRSLLAALALAVLAGGVFLGSRRGEVRAYRTGAVERGPVEATVTASGSLDAVTTVQVGTFVSGRIQAIDVDYNSPVATGQRVAKIDPAPFQVKVAQAEASLATARARVERARADVEFKRQTLERRRRLQAADVASENAFDEAVSAARQAEAEIALHRAGVVQAEAALEAARVDLAYTDIVSPVDGIVLSRNVDVGQTVAASFQTPTLFVIAGDLARMRLVANVSESDIGPVRTGQPVGFSVDAWPERSFRGVVREIRNAPIAVQNVVTYEVVIDVANDDHALKPGMTATVEIRIARREDALRAPARALRFRPEDPAREMRNGDGADAGDGPRVFVLRPGGLERVAVQVGIRGERHVELRAEPDAGGALSPGPPLRPGDELVLGYEAE